MRVLYGVCGEGMGHAMRSAVVGEHLRREGYEVVFATGGRPLEYLRAKGFETIPITSLELATDGKRISPIGTLVKNVFNQTVGGLLTALPSFAAVTRARPDAVVSDFDPWSARVALVLGAPLFAVDNIHFMNRCSHPTQIFAMTGMASTYMRPVADVMVPWARKYFVTTFVDAPVIEPGKTELHLPILRAEVLAQKGRPVRDHVVCYFNTRADHARIVGALTLVPEERFRLYGKPGLAGEQTYGNVTVCPFSDEAFLEDLSTSRAVIGGAGFTLMSEAIYLGKPMLAVPFGDQFEQILNARYLKMLEYGSWCSSLSAGEVRAFLGGVEGYREKLARFGHDGNRALLGAVSRAVRS
jgi:uncharacterized protein (TIGR00661 family)